LQGPQTLDKLFHVSTTWDGAVVLHTIFRSLWPTFHIKILIKGKCCPRHILYTVLCRITKLAGRYVRV